MNEETEEQPTGGDRYHIDPDWHERQGRSFTTFVSSRMCASCQEKLGTEVEERVPVVDKTGKVVFERQRVPYGANPFRVIRDCCAHTKGYITATMPLQEALFRVFLASGNQPMTVEEVKERLDEWFTTSDRRRYVELVTLKRLLDHDRFYGIRRLEVPVAGAV